MVSPKTPEQLADAIETVVASYLDEARRNVQHAVERSLPGQEAQVDFGSVGHLYDPAEGRMRPDRRIRSAELNAFTSAEP